MSKSNAESKLKISKECIKQTHKYDQKEKKMYKQKRGANQREIYKTQRSKVKI